MTCHSARVVTSYFFKDYDQIGVGNICADFSTCLKQKSPRGGFLDLCDFYLRLMLAVTFFLSISGF